MSSMHRTSLHLAALVAPLVASCGSSPADERTASTEAPLSIGGALELAPDRSGLVSTATPSQSIDTTNAYFQSLGTNGRTCSSCHRADQGWTVTPAALRARFDASDGTDPIFRPHDGANAPNLDVSTVEARRSAYSVMLSRAVVRIGLPVKPTSEFELVSADDPYGWASATQLSLFRRPLPTTNLRFLTAINWDGRSTPADVTDIHLGLKNQSNGATLNHAKAAAPIADDVRESIVGFETSLTTAQLWHSDVGPLFAGGATGGANALQALPFTPGANDPTQPGFTTTVFTLFDAWTRPHDTEKERGSERALDVKDGRARIADGQRVFNERTFAVAGGRTGTCSGCHSVPNVGNASSFRFFDVGISSPARRSSDVPLYTFRNTTTGETLQSTDPGRALITGKWADMNRFKVPVLRGLAARAPYFHDGSAKSIAEVVAHYEQHFSIDFSDGERRNLVMFLESL